jgi:hypothetical protein
MKCEYKIIDNLLSESLANNIKENLIENKLGFTLFPWYYFDSVVSQENDNLYNWQFVHMLYLNGSQTSQYLQLFQPIIDYLNPEAIIKIKANLNPRTEVRHTFDYHTDFNSKSSDRKTAIYYVNSNDGVTILGDGTEIESVANRLVIFDQKILHTGTTCTDQKVRCVINFNYIEHRDD